MARALPIIVLSRNSSTPPWISPVLLQARLTNPHSEVILISNMDPSELPRTQIATVDQGIRLANYDTYSESAKRFREIFFNIGANSAEFEGFCIERWFVLYEYAKRHGVNSCFVMDSDVMLYSNVTEIGKSLPATDITVLSGISWASVYIWDIEVIGRYCEMVREIYERRSPLWMKFAAGINLLQPGGTVGNVSDMALIGFFREHVAPTRNYTFFELGNVFNGGAFDPNLSMEWPEVQMTSEPRSPKWEQVKKLTWVDGVPFGTRKASGDFVRFHSLHFQGSMKELLLDLFREWFPLHLQRAREAHPDAR